MQHGASLFEIAIAVGVAGLLLGIILSVVNMMHGATVRNNVTSLQANDSAVGIFSLRYRELPGDMTANTARTNGFADRSGETGHGNGDGLIEGCDATTIRLGCENTLFWRDLSQANLIPMRFSTAIDRAIDGTAADFQLADYLPPSPFRRATSIFVYGLSGQNYFYVTRITAVAKDGALTTIGAVTPQEAQDLDDKMDDGQPLQGRLRSISSIGVYDTGEGATAQPCVDKTSKEYNTDSSAPACQLSIRASF